jgi:AcrR family transcriptional regulator
MGRATATGREARRLATRERLFSLAVAEFEKTGVADADVASIVAAAGVAHGTFFFHFPTKEHVVAELGQREEQRMAGQLDSYLVRPRDIHAILSEFVRLTMAMERRIGRKLLQDLLNLYFSPTRPELRLWPDHPVVARLIGEFNGARDRGEIDPDADPTYSVMIFLAGFYGLLLMHGRTATRVAMVDQLVDTTARAARHRDGSHPPRGGRRANPVRNRSDDAQRR